MALPKKTSRKIVVDGRNYRWAMSDSIGLNPAWRDGHVERAETLIVEIDGNINTRLYDRIALPKIAGAMWGFQDDSVVHPRHVAAVIRAAVKDGWLPDSGDNYESTILYDLLISEVRADFADRLPAERPSVSSPAEPKAS